MKTNVTREQGLRWAAQGMMVLLVLVGAFAVTQTMKVSELESAASQAKSESQKAGQDMAVVRKKMQDDLKAANAKAAELEGKQRESDTLKALLGKIEPQVAPILEAAARTGKPEARSAALTGLGLIGQAAHGANHDASLGVLVRALALDKGNCVAALAINLIGNQTVEVPSKCEGLLPGPAPTDAAKSAPEAKPVAEAKPATESKPSAEAKSPAAPGSSAVKSAQSAGKS